MDPILIFTLIAVLVLLFINFDVTRTLLDALNSKEPVDVLQGSFVVSASITLSIIGVGALAISGISVALHGPRLIPIELAIPILLLALFLPSIGNFFLRRKLRGLIAQAKRNAANQPHDRRSTDR